VPAAIEPMLATPDGGRLPDGPGFAYEFKWDFCARFRLLDSIAVEQPSHKRVEQEHCA
jgi:hypothetical protein